MPLTLGQNISSLIARRQLDRGSQLLSKAYERLSSGMRINSAADDAGGLAVASSLNVGARIYARAVRNVNDGITVTNIANSALDSLTSIVTRISELATQAANGTISAQQRNALDIEAQALSDEYSRIARSTTFNGSAIFNATYGKLNLQVGGGANDVISSGLGGAIGIGTLGSATSLSEGSASAFVYDTVLKDINSDGVLDLITGGGTDATTGYVNVRLGTGNGTFGTAVSYVNEATNTASILVDDINRDGILDLVTAGAGASSGVASIRLGRGDGTFGNVTTYSTEASSSYGAALGDLNADGILDLVTTGYTGFSGSSNVRLGIGDGTFGTATSFSAESGISRQVRLVDFNDDGKLDMITSGRDPTVSGYVTVRLGQGNGTFATATSTLVVNTGGGSFTWGMVVADLNNDGELDVVAGSNSASVLLGRGDGTFSAYSTITSVTSANIDIVAGDLNGDDILDLVTANLGGSTTTYIGNGDGSFKAATAHSDGSQSRTVSLADLNADGVLDVITGLNNSSSDAQINIRLTNTTDGVGPLLAFSLGTQQDAKYAMTLMSQKLTQLTAQRAQIGAFESRLNIAVNHLRSQEINYREAEGRIVDADVAEETANLVAAQVRNQVTTAILAQANSSTSIVLSLLNG